MGYRSDVICVIYGPREYVQAFIAAEAMLHTDNWQANKPYLTATTGTSTDDEVATLYLVWEFLGVKWYESYPDVISFNDMYLRATEVPELSVEFVRIGESGVEDVTHDVYGENAKYVLSVSVGMNLELDGCVPLEDMT